MKPTSKDCIEIPERLFTEIEDAFGPEELYGGSVLQAKFAPRIKASRDGSHAFSGTLFVLCDGDFDEDNRNGPRWIKFDFSSDIELLWNDEDGSFELPDILFLGYGQERNERKILSLFYQEFLCV